MRVLTGAGSSIERMDSKIIRMKESHASRAVSHRPDN